MSFLGQFLRLRGGANLPRDALGGHQAVEYENRGTNVVSLLPSGAGKGSPRCLRTPLTSSSTSIIHNYERRQWFFPQREINFECTRHDYYEKYEKGLE